MIWSASYVSGDLDANISKTLKKKILRKKIILKKGWGGDHIIENIQPWYTQNNELSFNIWFCSDIVLGMIERSLLFYHLLGGTDLELL